MQIYFFTFGTKHKHPSNGREMRNFWIEIEAESMSLAKEVMSIRHKGNWSNGHTESEFRPIEHFYPYGCYEKLTQIQ